MPEDFYSSDYYADKLIEFLSASPNDKPFFAYLPFTAPHWPLQAPRELIAKYKGKYDDGPAALRERRLSTQVNLGLLDDDVEPYPLTGGTDWESMTEEERKYSAKTMEIYSAMVENMDYNIEKVLDYLERKGQLDDTFVVFLSDNGAVLPFSNTLTVLGRSDLRGFAGNRAIVQTDGDSILRQFVRESRCRKLIHLVWSQLGPSSDCPIEDEQGLHHPRRHPLSSDRPVPLCFPRRSDL